LQGNVCVRWLSSWAALGDGRGRDRHRIIRCIGCVCERRAYRSCKPMVSGTPARESLLAVFARSR
jgi:hypothetical protein